MKTYRVWNKAVTLAQIMASKIHLQVTTVSVAPAARSSKPASRAGTRRVAPAPSARLASSRLSRSTPCAHRAPRARPRSSARPPAQDARRARTASVHSARTAPPESTSHFCIDSPGDKYSTSGTKQTSAAVCIGCGAGRYGAAGAAKVTACIDCAAGKYSTAGVAACLICGTGNTKAISCSFFTKGKYNDLAIGVAACKSCPADRSGSNFGAVYKRECFKVAVNAAAPRSPAPTRPRALVRPLKAPLQGLRSLQLRKCTTTANAVRHRNLA